MTSAVVGPEELLDLQYVADAGLWVGHFGAGRFAVWSERENRLVQALYLDAGAFAVTTTDDGRATVIAYPPDFSDSIVGELRGTASKTQFLAAYDLVTGTLRWRRGEPLRPELVAGTALRKSVVRYGMLFDASTGTRVKARPDALVPRPRAKRRRWQLPMIDPVELPGTIGRRPAYSGETRADEQRRAFHFGRDARPPTWSADERTPEIDRILRRLRAQEGGAPGAIGPVDDLPFPADIRAIYAAQSPWLRTRWGIDRGRVRALQEEARERGAPQTVSVFGKLGDGTLLCAQPTGLGCRFGMFNVSYTGPFPLTTALSQTLWSLVESRPPTDADERCHSMNDWLA